MKNLVQSTRTLNSESASESVRLDGQGIKNILSKYNYEKAIAEYIWNGFDAGAKTVRLDYKLLNGIGALESITITDDGQGIPRHFLQSKFGPFHASEKASKNDTKHHSLTHGKNGVGRLTFFTFANQASWSTVYQDENGKHYEYDNKHKSSSTDHHIIRYHCQRCGHV